MKCSKCGAEDQSGKFCQECGEELDNKEGFSESAEISGNSENAKDDGDKDEKNAEKGNKKDNSPSENAKDNEKSKEDNRDSSRKENDNINENENENGDKNENESENPSGGEDEEKSDEVKDALEKLEQYEQGTITDPKDKPKPKKKRSFLYPQNPMLWSFMMLLLFGAVLGVLSAVFFKTDLDGKEVVFGIVFSVFTAAVLGIDFAYYFPSALKLDRLLKGKGVRLEYGLKKYELIDLAEKAKKRNRGFYLAIGLFGLAFTIYYIYILATTVQQTALMWVSLVFSASVFAICGTLFFVMPKFNYGKMMENGSRVIIGNKSVYYGGTYYHWRRVQPDATFGKVNTKKHELEITFTQEFKNGKAKKQRVEMYAPDSALKGITKLLSEYEVNNKKYREKKEQMSVVNGKPVSK